MKQLERRGVDKEKVGQHGHTRPKRTPLVYVLTNKHQARLLCASIKGTQSNRQSLDRPTVVLISLNFFSHLISVWRRTRIGEGEAIQRLRMKTTGVPGQQKVRWVFQTRGDLEIKGDEEDDDLRR
ncbi:hypothetical protein NL676_035082 [Syzygium grande]|nr:hypothetical protein NL676_035082 [Syzygium grande]